MFDRLEGVFAVAVWDRDQLALYTERSGLHALYMHADSGRGDLAFATHPLALPAAPHLARQGLHEYLRFLDISAPNTVVDQVRRLQPGSVMTWPARLARGGHHDAPLRSATMAPASFKDAVDALEALLNRAVALRLESSGRPAAFLSGGIDSSVLCALAHRQRTDLVALTVGFDGERYDESPLAARVASHLGMCHEVLRFRHEDYISAFERLMDVLEQPMADPSTPATVLAFEHCCERFDVVLDGTGADEAVGATPPRHVRVAVQYGSLLPRGLRSVLVRAMRMVPVVAGYTPILDFDHPADLMMRWRGFTRAEIEQLCGEPVSFDHTTFYRTFSGFPRHAHYERYSALVDTMASDRLSQAMRAADFHQVRLPFFDRDTDRFIRQLPADWRYLPGEPKRILRALLERYVPRQIWDVPKHGFDFPLQWFLATNDHALVRRYLLAGRWLDRGVLDADGVRDYARRFIAGDQRLIFRVWALVVLGAWLERHEDVCAT
jgi:asparagine synthase (glutamine-hydrolysing)